MKTLYLVKKRQANSLHCGNQKFSDLQIATISNVSCIQMS
ncbi:hypothetical protein FDUTEX481_01906 [Tolypothrix sp. PCC 7601]|nr:hypothetical protein FDUTEX481_01906 [Tolypothrix sp. PCC 7601]